MYQWEMLKAHQLKKPTEDLSLKETEVSKYCIRMYVIAVFICCSSCVLLGVARVKATAKFFIAIQCFC